MEYEEWHLSLEMPLSFYEGSNEHVTVCITEKAFAT